MRAALILVVALAVFASCDAHFTSRVTKLTRLEDGMPIKIGGPIDTCADCVAWASNALQAILQAILNLETDACGDLCSQLPTQGDANICDLLCDIVGIYEFIQIVNKADLDPIYFCQMHKKCVETPNGNGRMLDSNVVPKKGARTDTFTVNITFSVTDAVGAGEFLNVISSTTQSEVSEGLLYDEIPVGNYIANLQLSLQDDPQGGTTWHTGNYTVQTWFCMGQCFSHHPYTKEFGYHNSTFVLANQSDDDIPDDDGFLA